ncbi:hypothetical protein XBI1_2740064 [Xenorhabdus bovienii str. Intermedium]|uniref:Uncharacterized protein n=1 Tax=Xenorhabdus bovienii str. Intermedium TaxID=1379677 RepID=A0A077QN19_XENBV|nr:hypothetical protein XBI1_2740064 [Xenorhabdus bovienii str. Intermedium]
MSLLFETDVQLSWSFRVTTTAYFLSPLRLNGILCLEHLFYKSNHGAIFYVSDKEYNFMSDNIVVVIDIAKLKFMDRVKQRSTTFRLR